MAELFQKVEYWVRGLFDYIMVQLYIKPRFLRDFAR